MPGVTSEEAEVPVLHSALARELSSLGGTTLGRLQLPLSVVGVIETAFRCGRAYGSGGGAAVWGGLEDGLNDLSMVFSQDVEVGADDEFELPAWLKNFQSSGWRFLQRSVGAGNALKLRRALKSDMAELGPVLRKGLRDLLPLARAFDLCAQEGTTGASGVGSLHAVEMIFQIDEAIDKRLAQFVGEEFQSVAGRMSFASLVDLLPLLGPDIEAAVVDLLAEVGSPLLRKLRGARQVLGATSDDVSQAAHSLIEFIDRTLRNAFSPDETVAWVSKHLPSRLSDLTWVSDGVSRRPTKLAEALCLLHAGCAPPKDYSIAELTARALVAARKGLQDLKHADLPTTSEREALEHHFAVVESAFLLVIRMGWRLADEEALNILKNRLAVAA